MPSKLNRYSHLSLCVFAFLYQACSSSPENSEASDDSTSNSSGDESEVGDSNNSKADASTGSSGSTTGDGTVSGDTSSGSDASSGTSTGTSSGSESETGSETAGSESSETGSSEDGDTPALKDNGEQCQANEECVSKQCNMSLPGIGICSECVDDAACQASGKGMNCKLGKGAISWFICGKGELGENCMSDEGCKEELACANVLGFQSCSECEEDKDCTTDDKTLCVLKFSVGFPDPSDPGPHLACEAPGSLKNGQFCNLETNGEEACEEHCAETPMTIPLPPGYGLCGECRNDDDCEMGEKCKEAKAEPMELIGSMCEMVDDETTGDSGTETGDTGETTGDSGETGTGDSGGTTTAYGEF